MTTDEERIAWMKLLWAAHKSGFPLPVWEENFCMRVLQYTFKSNILIGKQREIVEELHHNYSKMI